VFGKNTEARVPQIENKARSRAHQPPKEQNRPVLLLTNDKQERMVGAKKARFEGFVLHRHVNLGRRGGLGPALIHVHYGTVRHPGDGSDALSK